MRGRSIKYTAEQLNWIQANCTKTRAELTAAFSAQFNRPDITVDNIKALCTRKGWKTGRDGRIQPGNVPSNKGKKMPYNAASAATQFKKGNRTGRANHVYKPIGTERLSKDGYFERKIHDGLPMQSRWRLVHLLNWEAVNGPIPKGMCLKSIDGNRQNLALSNWELIARATLVQLNHRTRVMDYDAAPSELKPTLMTLAKIHQAKGVKRRKQKSV